MHFWGFLVADHFWKLDGSGHELDGIWLFGLVLSRLVSEINKFFPAKSDLNL